MGRKHWEISKTHHEENAAKAGVLLAETI